MSDFDDDFATMHPEASGSHSFDETEHKHDDFCGPNGEFCNSGKAKGTDNSSHVKDTAGHPNRRINIRGAIQGAIAGAKSEPAPKEPKKPLRDRIADKIATKPKDEGSSTESAAPKAPHEHDFECDDFCDK